ncbi:Nuclease HARBI1 [Phytophthora megakarya]|uniref:Nuclease HARBI1 n=1 Tax=Phytophthora megakarya TaxID=4795 RepID=A0A225UQL6_9STRA|nr:Nuclease HARBI1 [Phytophthora megakarya]
MRLTRDLDPSIRAPNEDDMNRLLTLNSRRGFVGMGCSIDGMHWEWKNCPYGWAGQFKGKEKKPTVVLEACADQDLWIWHASFGWPGSLNDLNILDRSPVFDNLMNGKAPSVKFEVNGNVYDMAYCLADGIYPDWPVFMKSLLQPRGNKQKKFAEMQEKLRKDVERAFGVLQARWRILAVPCKLHSRLDMAKVMRACIVLHNMICEENRFSHVDENGYLFDDIENEHLYRLRVSRPTGLRPRSIGDITSQINAMENSASYFRLQKDIVEHIWRVFGEDDE